MKKRLRFALAIFLTVVLAGAVVLILRPRPKDPLYEGKTASYWIRHASHVVLSESPPFSPDANELPRLLLSADHPARIAFAGMMPDAVPILLKALEAPDRSVAFNAASVLGEIGPIDDAMLASLLQRSQIGESSIHRSYRIFWSRLPKIASSHLPKPEVPQSFLNRRSDYWYRKAEPSLAALNQLLRRTRKEKASNPTTIAARLKTVSALSTRLGAREDWTCNAAAIMLVGLETNGKAALPALLRELQNTNRDPEVRVAVARAIGEVGRDSPEAMRGVLSAISDRARVLQCAAIVVLGKSSTCTNQTLPVLQGLWDSDDKLLRYLAYLSLRNLDPEWAKTVRKPEPIFPTGSGVSYSFHKIGPPGSALYSDDELFYRFALAPAW